MNKGTALEFGGKFGKMEKTSTSTANELTVKVTGIAFSRSENRLIFNIVITK